MVCIDKHGPFWHTQPHGMSDTGPHPAAPGMGHPVQHCQSHWTSLTPSSTHFCFPHCCAVTRSVESGEMWQGRGQTPCDSAGSQEQGQSGPRKPSGCPWHQLRVPGQDTLQEGLVLLPQSLTEILLILAVQNNHICFARCGLC